MKSFVAYPIEMEKILYPEVSEHSFSGKLLAHYELFKRIAFLEGSIVKCGISAEASFMRFASFRNLIAEQSNHKVVAFEKQTKSLYIDNEEDMSGTLLYKVKSTTIDTKALQKKLLKKGLANKIEFVPGNLGDSIPEYLMENPDFKISFLNIDMDDYDAALIALQFFYPRLVHGGILIFDNYYKEEEDFRAVQDYFQHNFIHLSNFSINKGPHYLVRQ